MKPEESFVAFVDLLGFSEANKELTEEVRFQVFQLLSSLVALRSVFIAIHESLADGSTRHWVRPTISNFSDNIVISYSLDSLLESLNNKGVTDATVRFLVYPQFVKLLATIAATALRLGFLIRGGATIGNLYHANGVVFGEALIEAVELERRTAI